MGLNSKTGRRIANVGSAAMLILAVATGFQDAGSLATNFGSLVSGHMFSFILALAGFVLWAFANMETIERWFGFNTDRVLKEQVKRFLEEWHYHVESRPKEPNVVFAWNAKSVRTLNGEESVNHQFTVIKRSDAPEVPNEAILLGVTLELDAAARLRISEMAPPARARALSTITTELAAAGVHYGMTKPKGVLLSPGDGFETVATITLEEMVFVTDGLNRRDLFDACIRLKTARVLVENLLVRETDPV